jgi:hypothetical protein
MTDASRRTLGWAPRLLGIAFALFVSLFALDVFGEGLGLGQTLVALMMHLAPTFAVLIALMAAWRHEWLGALLFPAVGVLFLYIARGPAARVVFAGIPFTIALLFLMSWWTHAKRALS